MYYFYSFECEICKETFLGKSDLDLHMDMHEIVQVHKETVEIQKVETINNTNQCEYCGKILSSPFRLKVHHRQHTNERPYKCEVCDARFRVSSVLQSHMLIHK